MNRDSWKLLLWSMPPLVATWLVVSTTTPLLVKASSKPASPVVRSVSLVETSTDARGATVKARHRTYVRSDGSEAKFTELLDPQTGSKVYENRELVFSDGLIVWMTPEVKTRSSRRASAERLVNAVWAMRRNPASNCLSNYAGQDLGRTASEEYVGIEQIGGYPAVHIRIRQQPQVEAWYAPALGCELLRQVTRYRYLDAKLGRWIDGESVKSMEFISLGQPDPNIFFIPPGFEEVKPSELSARIMQMLTGKRMARNSRADAALDKRWLENRR